MHQFGISPVVADNLVTVYQPYLEPPARILSYREDSSGTHHIAPFLLPAQPESATPDFIVDRFHSFGKRFFISRCQAHVPHSFSENESGECNSVPPGAQITFSEALNRQGKRE